jgi:hypothetical protein
MRIKRLFSLSSIWIHFILTFDLSSFKDIMNASIMKHSIRYLNQNLRFFISNFVSDYSDIDESSFSSMKSSTNLAIIKRFSDITRDTAMIKKWKIDKFKIVIEISIYMLVLNKKNRIDYTVKNSNHIIFMLSFHYLIAHESRIFEKFILFSKRMSMLIEKTNIVIQMTIDHFLWKQQTHLKYKRRCRKYFATKMIWKILMIEKMRKISKILWSQFDKSIDELLQIIMNLNISSNCRSLVKVEESDENWQWLLEKKNDYEENDYVTFITANIR